MGIAPEHVVEQAVDGKIADFLTWLTVRGGISQGKPLGIKTDIRKGTALVPGAQFKASSPGLTTQEIHLDFRNSQQPILERSKGERGTPVKDSPQNGYVVRGLSLKANP